MLTGALLTPSTVIHKLKKKQHLQAMFEATPGQVVVDWGLHCCVHWYPWKAFEGYQGRPTIKALVNSNLFRELTVSSENSMKDLPA